MKSWLYAVSLSFSYNETLIFGLVLVGFLLASIIVSIIGQQLLKSYFVRSGKELLEYNNPEEMMTQYIEDLNYQYKIEKRNNDNRRRLLFTSFVLNSAFCLVLIASVIVIMIIM